MCTTPGFSPDADRLDPVKTLMALYKDVRILYPGKPKDLKRDIHTIKDRIECQGLGFATKILPQFYKHILLCLQNEAYSPTSLFKKKSRKGLLPAFLWDVTSRIFDAGTGHVLPCAAPALKALAQICLLFYKLEGQYTRRQEDEKFNDFLNLEGEISEHVQVTPAVAGVADCYKEIIESIFTGFDAKEIDPRPGPGAVAGGEESHERFEPHTLYKGIHECFPYYDYFYTRSNRTFHLLHRVGQYRSLPRREFGTAKLLAVPKDSRGPRLICKMPHEFMWFQQGLGNKMVSHLENHPITKGYVNFTDQTINQKLALCGSKGNTWATLDEKEASDRIATDLVAYGFEDLPMFRYLLALQTTRVEVRGKIHVTKKFAPMGSALCFPVMAVVNYALALASISLAEGREWRSLIGTVFVYGDDIIVPNNYAKHLFVDFPAFGLKFNESKSFTKGLFRESCGCDAFNGIDITPVKLKTLQIRKTADSLSKWTEQEHAFRVRGYDYTAKLIHSSVTHSVGCLPYVTECASGIGWIIPSDASPLLYNSDWKWSKDLQSWRLKALVPQSKAWCSMVGGWERLVREQLLEPGDPQLAARYRSKLLRKRVPLSGA